MLHSYIKKVLVVPIIKIEKAPKNVPVARVDPDHMEINVRLVRLCCQCGAGTCGSGTVIALHVWWMSTGLNGVIAKFNS